MILKKGMKGTEIQRLQQLLNNNGIQVTIDGEFGPKTENAVREFQRQHSLVVDGIAGPKTLAKLQQYENDGKIQPGDAPPWYIEAKKHEGKKETDKKFAAIMVPLWKKLFKMNLGTIATSWSAWCGLGMGACLMWAGMTWQADGALARNWGKYGDPIEWKVTGIPRGAIVHINHKYNCNSSSGNHVAQADGDCAPEDLLKADATINLYGANQGNAWKVSTYPVKEICAVRWPKEYPKPPKVTKSLNCTSGRAGNESTR